MFYNDMVSTDQLAADYHRATNRLFLLDYDGVLAPIMPLPEQAAPSLRTYRLLEKLTADPRNFCVVISGRPRETLDEWLGHLPLDFAAEHGLWRRSVGRWSFALDANMGWKKVVAAIMHRYVSLLPGSFIEEKDAALALHYRNVADQEEAERVISSLNNELANLAIEVPLQVLSGKKVIEVLPAGVDKGAAAQFWIKARDWDFILAAGDDVTDEALFKAMPEGAYSIKVGSPPTAARDLVSSQEKFMQLLESLAGL